jgi:hypothetical protein
MFTNWLLSWRLRGRLWLLGRGSALQNITDHVIVLLHHLWQLGLRKRVSVLRRRDNIPAQVLFRL